MNNIEQIINEELETHAPMMFAEERSFIAKKISDKLISQSLEQLAMLLDGSVEYNHDGSIVIHTGLSFDG